MHQDFEGLIDINLKISKAEDNGDRAFFEDLLASSLAFKRADPAGTVVDRKTFLDALKQSGPRQSEIESISFLGKQRALVTCVVSMRGADGKETRYHNLRLFIRSQDQKWKLLGWANEPMS